MNTKHVRKISIDSDDELHLMRSRLDKLKALKTETYYAIQDWLFEWADGGELNYEEFIKSFNLLTSVSMIVQSVQATINSYVMKKQHNPEKAK